MKRSPFFPEYEPYNPSLVGIQGWEVPNVFSTPQAEHEAVRTAVGLLDWSVTGRIYGAALANMFQSFWARFGWNHVALAPWWYRILAGWMAIGAVGAVVALVRLRGQSAPSVGRALALLAVAGLLVWGLCFLRTDYFRPFLPGARYAYPAIVPTVLALMAGWLVWAPRQGRKWAALGLLSGVMLLNVVSLITIGTFYY